MIKESYTIEQKLAISKEIKNITLEEIDAEMNQLIQIGVNASTMSPRSRIGNKIVDYFTFSQRLSTRGKYDINFYEFIINIDEFKKKNFIQTMLHYYETTKNKTKKKNYYTVMKEVYNICISAINIIRPLVYMEIYTKYKPSCILDFCAGWGGAAVAASALNIPKYIGIEINNALIEPYNNLVNFLKERSKTEIQMIFDSALTIDYSKLDYDLVFTSPPYYFIQKYENNKEYSSKKEMDEKFYIPLFSKTYANLKSNGIYALNINKEVYENVCVKLFGEAHDSFPYKKS
jgi:tRNA1(Val) A37 N6-methylase TrmN6